MGLVSTLFFGGLLGGALVWLLIRMLLRPGSRTDQRMRK
jgi:hypothetical protein